MPYFLKKDTGKTIKVASAAILFGVLKSKTDNFILNYHKMECQASRAAELYELCYSMFFF